MNQNIYESKYPLLIKNPETTEFNNHFINSKAFIEYSNDMKNI